MTVYWRKSPTLSTSWFDRSDGCVLPLGLVTASVLGIVQVASATDSSRFGDCACRIRNAYTEEGRFGAARHRGAGWRSRRPDRRLPPPRPGTRGFRLRGP